jgi:hypothetical protein
MSRRSLSLLICLLNHARSLPQLDPRPRPERDRYIESGPGHQKIARERQQFLPRRLDPYDFESQFPVLHPTNRTEWEHRVNDTNADFGD